jgi:hypothetical protein
MSNSKKPVEVIFAPGCFDHLDVADQAELDAVVKEITEMFANMTAEELPAQSCAIDWDRVSEEERLLLDQALDYTPRTLQ